MAKGGKFSDGTIVIGTTVDTAGINSGLMRIRNSFKRLSLTMAGFLGIQSLVNLGKAAVNAASELQEVQNIVDVTFDDLEWKMEAFASTAIETYGMSEFMAKSVAGQFMAMGKASGIAADDAANMALQLTALTGDMASFYNISHDYARVALSAVYTGETETLKRYGIILTEANLQEYAHSIGIETSVKKMDAKSKAMLRYQYILEQTQHIQGDFIRTEENWANQVRVLQERWRQFLVTLGSGLITVLTPVIKTLNMVLQYVTAWANAVGEILAKLLGLQWQDFTEETAQLSNATADLADVEDDLGDSLASTGKKAKKMLQPFDDLNVLTTKSASNASGLASDIGVAIADFQTAFDVEGGGFEFELPDIESWYEFGKFLSETLAGLLDRIPWAEIQAKAQTLATNLADFINGGFQPETFATIGTTIAQGLNTAVDYAFTLGNGLDFENIGASFAEGVNSFFTDFDFSQLADTIDLWVQGLWTAVRTFLKGNTEGEGGLDWPLIHHKLNEFLSSIDIQTIEIVAKVILFKKLTNALFSGQVTNLIAKSLGKKLGAVWVSMGGLAGLSNKPFEELVLGTSWATKLITFGATAAAAFFAGWMGTVTGTGLGYSLSELLGGDTSTYEPYLGFEGAGKLWGDLGKALEDFVKDADISRETLQSMNEDGIFAFTPDLDGLREFADLYKELTEAGFTDEQIRNAMKYGESLEDVRQELLGISEEDVEVPLTITMDDSAFTDGFFNNLGDKLRESWENIKEGFNTKWNEFKTNISTSWDTFKTNAVNKWEELKLNLSTIWENIKTTAQTKWDEFKTNLKTRWDTFKTNVKLKWEELKANLIVIWDNIKSKATEKWELIKNTIGEKIAKVKADLESKWNTLKSFLETNWSTIKSAAETKWLSIKKTISTYVEQLKAQLEIKWNNVKEKAIGIWTEIKDGIKQPINDIIGVIESFVNKVIDGINLVIDTINKFSVEIPKIPGITTEAFTFSPDISKLNHVTIPGLAQGAVIPPNREFVAVLGDQKHGTNIEAPLDTIVQAFKLALSENDSNLMMNYLAQQVELLGIIADKPFGITDREVFNSVRKSANQYTKITGENAF